MPINHAHISLIPDNPTKDISSGKWNDDHTIELTRAELVAAIPDAVPMFVGDAPTAHTHLLAAGATDVTITAANLNALDDGADTTLHFHAADRARAVHTGTQLASTISDFDAAVAATAAVTANTAKVSNATHTGDVTGSGALTLATVNSNVGSFGLAGSVAQFAVNAKGLITSAANVAISIAATAISDATAAGRAMLTAATAAAQTALLDVFTSGAKGLAPASGGGTSNYLRADGTWAAPSAGAAGSTTQIQYNDAGALAGAANVSVENAQLRLAAIASPATPAAGGVSIIGRADAGRTVPAFLSQDGVVRELQTDLGTSIPMIYRALAGSGSFTWYGFNAAPSFTGTVTNIAFSTANLIGYIPRVGAYVTTPAASAVAAVRGASLGVTVGGGSAGLGGFKFLCTAGPSTGVSTSTHRWFSGMFSAAAGAPTDVEPSTQVSCIGIGYDAADTNVQMMHNDASGNCTKIDLGASFPKPTANDAVCYEVRLLAHRGTTQRVDYLVREVLSGAVASGSITTNLPATSLILRWASWISVGGTSSVIGLTVSSMYCDPLL